MKKLAIGLALTMTVGIYTVPAIAASSVYPAAQQEAFDESTAIKNYIAAQEARKGYMQDLYNRDLITKERYDLSIANIQANIDYVKENGLGASYGGYGRGGYGYGGCCGGFGMGW